MDGTLAIGGNTVQFSPARLGERRTTLLAESVRFSALTKRLPVVREYPTHAAVRFVRLETFGAEQFIFAFLAQDGTEKPEIEKVEKFYDELRRFVARARAGAEPRDLTETSGSESFDFDEYGLPASAGAVMSAVRTGKDKGAVCERRVVVYHSRHARSTQNG